MKIIRNQIFETNSSSTHAIVISHNTTTDVNTDIREPFELPFDSDRYIFGREKYRQLDRWDEKLAYIYYALKSYENKEDFSHEITEKEVNNFKAKISNIYNNLMKGYKASKIIPSHIFDLIDTNLDRINSYSKLIFTNEEGELVTAVSLTNRFCHIYQDNEGNIKIRKWEKGDRIDTFPTADEIQLREPTLNEIKEHKLIEEGIFSDKDDLFEVYVDHIEGLKANGFITVIINATEEYLERFIFNNNSYITIGGDEYEGYYIEGIGFENDYDEFEPYQVNERGERCPNPDQFKDFDEYWEEQKKYPITKDDGGFWDKLEEYRKSHDVFLKGN